MPHSPPGPHSVAGFAAVAALERRLIAGVIAVTLVLLVAATGVISQVALGAFRRVVLPEMGREATAVGTALAGQIGRAVALGVPADRLVGLEPFFQQTLASRPALDSIRLDMPGLQAQAARAAGPARAARDVQDVAVAVPGPAGPLGTLRLGVNPSRLERSAADSTWDIAIVLLVAVLATVEALMFLTDRFVSTPLRLVDRLASRVAAGDWTVRAQQMGLDAAGRFLSRMNALVRRMNERRRHVDWLAAEVAREAPHARGAAARVVAGLAAMRFAPAALGVEAIPRSVAIARAPLFLYVFAEQLSTSFIPLFAKTLAQPRGWVPATLAVSLPITAFAGVIALASPFGARLAGRLGTRGVLALGVVPAILGYAMTAQAQSVEAFTLWRAVTAVGYALITIACQSYLVAASEEAGVASSGGRGRTMAVFVYAAMTGALCGTAIGAVLADRIGFRGTFIASAALTACAGLLAWQTMDRGAGRRAVRPSVSAAAGARGIAWRNPGFVALVLLGAVPAKLVLSGFIFTIAPLFLQSLGDSQPEIGRQVMLYAGTMLLTIRLGAFAADRLGAALHSIGFAGVATGVGLLLATVLPPGLGLPLAIAAVGLSQGLASAPMLAVVPELCPELAARLGVATLYGYLRLAERIGSIVGPALAALLAGLFGFTAAIGAIGAVSLVTAIGYWAASALIERRLAAGA